MTGAVRRLFASRSWRKFTANRTAMVGLGVIAIYFAVALLGLFGVIDRDDTRMRVLPDQTPGFLERLPFTDRANQARWFIERTRARVDRALEAPGDLEAYRRLRSELALADASDLKSKPDLVASPVYRHPMYFFCRREHEILRLERPQLSDLAAYPWAGTRAPARIADFFPREIRRAGSWQERTGDFLPALALDVVQDIARITLASDVIAVAPLAMIEQALHSGALVRIPIAAPWLRLEYALIGRSNRTRSTVAAAFSELLVEVEDELQQREAALRAQYAIS